MFNNIPHLESFVYHFITTVRALCGVRAEQRFLMAEKEQALIEQLTIRTRPGLFLLLPATQTEGVRWRDLRD